MAEWSLREWSCKDKLDIIEMGGQVFRRTENADSEIIDDINRSMQQVKLDGEVVVRMMSINMGKASNTSCATAGVESRRQCLNFCLQSEYADLFFVQELFGPTRTTFGLDIPGRYSMAGDKDSKESALIWNNETFTDSFLLDWKHKSTSRKKTQERVKVDISTFVQRVTAAVLVNADEYGNKNTILAISWHGPWTGKSEQRRLDSFDAFQHFALQLREDLPPKWKENGPIGIVIGGDFNLNLMKDGATLHKGFALAAYEASDRRRRGEVIDHFLFSHEEITLYEPECLEMDQSSPASSFSAGQNEGMSQQMLYSIDHDPIIANLLFRPLLAFTAERKSQCSRSQTLPNITCPMTLTLSDEEDVQIVDQQPANHTVRTPTKEQGVVTNAVSGATGTQPYFEAPSRSTFHDEDVIVVDDGLNRTPTKCQMPNDKLPQVIHVESNPSEQGVVTNVVSGATGSQPYFEAPSRPTFHDEDVIVVDDGLNQTLTKCDKLPQVIDVESNLSETDQGMLAKDTSKGPKNALKMLMQYAREPRYPDQYRKPKMRVKRVFNEIVELFVKRDLGFLPGNEKDAKKVIEVLAKVLFYLGSDSHFEVLKEKVNLQVPSMFKGLTVFDKDETPRKKANLLTVEQIQSWTERLDEILHFPSMKVSRMKELHTAVQSLKVDMTNYVKLQEQKLSYPDMYSNPGGNGHKLYNDVIILLKTHGLGFLEGEENTVGKATVESVTMVLFYINPASRLDLLRQRTIFEIPALFQELMRFPYNTESQALLAPMSTQDQQTLEYSLFLISKLPVMNFEHMKQLRSAVEILQTGLLNYIKHLEMFFYPEKVTIDTSVQTKLFNDIIQVLQQRNIGFPAGEENTSVEIVRTLSKALCFVLPERQAQFLDRTLNFQTPTIFSALALANGSGSYPLTLGVEHLQTVVNELALISRLWVMELRHVEELRHGVHHLQKGLQDYIEYLQMLTYPVTNEPTCTIQSRLFNNVVTILRHNNMGFTATEVNTSGRQVTQAVTDTLYYIYPRLSLLKRRFDFRMPYLFECLVKDHACGHLVHALPAVTVQHLAVLRNSLTEVLRMPVLDSIAMDPLRKALSMLHCGLDKNIDYLRLLSYPDTLPLSSSKPYTKLFNDIIHTLQKRQIGFPASERDASGGTMIVKALTAAIFYINPQGRMDDLERCVEFQMPQMFSGLNHDGYNNGDTFQLAPMTGVDLYEIILQLNMIKQLPVLKEKPLEELWNAVDYIEGSLSTFKTMHIVEDMSAA